MRNSAIFLCLCLFVLAPSSSSSQVSAANKPGTDKIPPVILEGLHQLAIQKPEEVEKAWYLGSAAEGNTGPGDLATYMANQDLGAYQDFDVVSVQDLTPRMRILYLALNFEKRPIVVRFELYRTRDGWITLWYKAGIDVRIFEAAAPSRQ